MTTIQLHLQRQPLPVHLALNYRPQWLLNVINFFDEVGQVISGALHFVPGSPDRLNPALRKDLGL